MPLPLEPGSRGDDVRDLHLRLADAGFAVRALPNDTFSEDTTQAVRAFQQARGLPTSGRCDGPTWQQLVEAGHRLGDRLLYLHTPMLRGDDVSDLQLRLGSLGFDAGWIDGIFGPMTERALADFQRNAGLPTDAIAGQDTVRELRRLGAKSDQHDPVAAVRERERLRQSPRRLVDRRVVIGEFGGAAAVVLSTARNLRARGAVVVTLHHPDPSTQALEANRAAGELYLGVRLSPIQCCAASYFATTGFVSYGGRRLATVLATHTAPLLDAAPHIDGNRTSVLRETRMPAVLFDIGPTAFVSGNLATIAAALARAVESWVVEPFDDGSPPQVDGLSGP